MTCLRHPAVASHRGHCPACLLEDALGGKPQSPPARRFDAGITIQLPLGGTTLSSVFVVKSQRMPSRLLRLKTWQVAAPSDFMVRFHRLQHRLSEWNDRAAPAPLAAWIDDSGRAWVLSEFNQGLPIVDRIRSGGIDPIDAESCLGRLREIILNGHRRGLVHGALRSGNIIVTARCRSAYLLDFGHAALLAGDADEPPAESADLAALDRLKAAVRVQTGQSVSL